MSVFFEKSEPSVLAGAVVDKAGNLVCTDEPRASSLQDNAKRKKRTSTSSPAKKRKRGRPKNYETLARENEELRKQVEKLQEALRRSSSEGEKKKAASKDHADDSAAANTSSDAEAVYQDDDDDALIDDIINQDLDAEEDAEIPTKRQLQQPSPKKKTRRIRKTKPRAKNYINYEDPQNKVALDAAVEQFTKKIKKRDQGDASDDDNNTKPPTLPDGTIIPNSTLRRYAEKQQEETSAAIELPKKRGYNRRNEVSWMASYKKLQQFKQILGHTNVPVSYYDGTSSNSSRLGKWVNFQRTGYKRFMEEGDERKNCLGMNQERVDLLNEIGFVWKLCPTPAPWEMRFLQLKEFKRKEGHCNVPQHYADNKTLGLWVKAQRQQYKLFGRDAACAYKKCSIKQDQINRLEAIGFQWSILKRPPR